MTMMDPNAHNYHAMSLPPVWRNPAGQSQSPAQYAQSQGMNWSQAVNDRNAMQGYYGAQAGNNRGGDYSGGRYVPPTFQWGYDSSGNIDPNRSQMLWNDQRNYYTPEQNYRFPTMPNFMQMMGMFGGGGYNPFDPYGGGMDMGIFPGEGGSGLGYSMDDTGGFMDFYQNQQGGGFDMNDPRFTDAMRAAGMGYDPESAAADPEGFSRWLEQAQASLGGQSGPPAPNDGTKPATEPSGVTSLWDQMQQRGSPRMGPRRPMMPQFGQGGMSPYMSRFGMGFSPWQMLRSNGNPFYGRRGGRRGGMGPFGG